MSPRRRTHPFLSRVRLTTVLTLVTLAAALLTAVISGTGVFARVDAWLVDLRLNWHTWNWHPDPNASPTSPFGDVALLLFDEDDLAAARADAIAHFQEQGDSERVAGVGLWHDRELLQWMVLRSLQILVDLKEANAEFVPSVVGLDFYNLGDPQNPHMPEMAEALNEAAGRLGRVIDGYRISAPQESPEQTLLAIVGHGYLDLMAPRDRLLDLKPTHMPLVRASTPELDSSMGVPSLAWAVAEEAAQIDSMLYRRLIHPQMLPPVTGDRALFPLFLPPRSPTDGSPVSAFPVIHFRDLQDLDALLGAGANPAAWPRLGMIYDRVLIVGIDLPDVDRVETPYSNRLYGNQTFPGAEVHAQVVYNLLNGTGLIPFHWRHSLLSWLIFVLLMGGSAWLAGRLALGWSMLAGLVMLAGLAGIDTWLWHLDLVWLPLAQWLFGIAVANRLAAQVLARRERRARALVTERLEQHVTSKVAQHLIHEPKAAELGGERREVTVLFSDLQGFTAMTERLPAEEMLEIMNRYLDAMSREIAAEDGTLANYVGDAIFAIFGAPEALEKHAEHAVSAAIRMQRALEEFNVAMESEGGSPLRQRIGLSTGEVLCGNVGGSDRFIWTAMGDAVPVGARLEPLNKKYGTSILMSHVTREQLGEEIKVRLVDRGIRVRGREGALDVYTVDP